MKNKRDRITTIAGILTGLLFVCGATSAQQVITEAEIVLTNSGSPQGTRTLIFGVNPGATLGIDTEHGEDAFPPFPPSAVFEARFVSHGGSELSEGSPADVRPYTSGTQKDEYKIRFQPGTNGLPITITWDMAYLKAHYTSVKMTDPFGGLVLNVDMLTSATTQVTNAALTEVVITAEGPKDPSSGVGDETAEVGLRFNLHSIPNPADQAMTINYTLPNALKVTLTITDLKGETVAQIAENAFREAGAHQENFDTKGLADGVYFVVLQGEGVMTTTPMILAR